MTLLQNFQKFQMASSKKSQKHWLFPIFVGLTLLYSFIYHVIMIVDDVMQDECDEQAHAAGMFPPHCLERETFREWHKQGTEDLLAVAPEPQEPTVPKAPMAEPKKSLLHSETAPTAIVVDESGDTFAETISTDLAGLEKKFSQLVVSSQAVVTNANQKSTEELEKHVEHRANLIRDVVHTMDKLDTKLADVVSDRKAWESTVLAKHDAKNAIGQTVPQTKDSFMAKRLQWSSVPTVHHYKVKGSEVEQPLQKQPIVVSKKDVRHLHWTGKLPKVAAVAWIKGGRKARSRMMYFVDNFKLQDYKGPSQLLLVYHYKDTQAAEIVRHHVDGIDVKAVAAHDFSQELFPSDPALRYAAWASDADVIAQWDFEEWHDPSRLALQVNAMAHTGRHACVLSTMSTSHSQSDEDKEISLVSLVGERSWMEQHWHPFSKRVLEVSESFKAGGLVELDMQNKDLMSNISRIEHVFTEAATTAAPVTQAAATPAGDDAAAEEGTSFSRGITECLNYDHSKGKASEDAAEKAVLENAGADVGKKFHDLVKKRHDITMKLQLLCFQTSMEHDKGKRKFMHDHVLEMDRIGAELDKHIKNTASLFGAPDLVSN